MTRLHSLPLALFDRIILRHPLGVIVILACVTVFLGLRAADFRLDASAETLVLENDEDLQYARLVDARYGGSDLLVLTFTPHQDLFSDGALAAVRRLRQDLREVKGVQSVTTLLDVPLLESPPIPITELRSTVRTLESPDVDRDLARQELRTSPLYENLLVSPDLRTTALLVTFPPDPVHGDLLRRRNELHEKKATVGLTGVEREELRGVVAQFQRHRDQVRQARHRDLVQIRTLMDQVRQEGTLFLGGVSMIADDMVTFVQSDLRVFGAGVFVLLILALVLLFRRTAWVVLPTLICAVSALWVIGLLVWLGWEVTVISANFISLQLIITLAMSIHLVMRYREMAAENPLADQHELVLGTLRAILRPCVYSGLTTMGGFASLIFCDIRPVISFGWIMVVGVAVSMLTPLLLLPAILIRMPRERGAAPPASRWSFTSVLGRFTAGHGPLIIVLTAGIAVLSAIGISRLQVENCFINYFKDTTEIHRGLKVIDRQLGGTTPLDVVIDLGPAQGPAQVDPNAVVQTDATFEDFTEFEDSNTAEDYWFTPEKIARVAAVHDYLEGLPETGQVLSVATLVRMVERANGGKPLDSLELALLFKQVPDSIRDMLVRPYASVEHNQVRLSVRVLDSEPSLRRNELLQRIQRDLTGPLGLNADQVHLSGLLVLYNNMLQSLYGSQVLTLGLAALMLFGAFTVVFRSFRLALIAIFPNSLAVAIMLGTMGWLGIPLDMMTITIAAIGVGLADDDTIHYIHRFGHEFKTHHSYVRALYRSHASIGNAIYNTTLTLCIGFSILTLSNFIPSIYFGLLTVLAISVALLASLTLLPQLLVMLKPFGKERAPSRGSSEGDRP